MSKSTYIIIFNFIFLSACFHQPKPLVPNLTPTENIWRTDQPPSIKEISKAVNKGQVADKLTGMKEWWLYGPGMGKTLLNVGTTIIFPPYALYLLTNAGLSLSGYQPIKPIESIPEGPREVIDEALDGITSVPGRVTAFVNGQTYFDQKQLSAKPN